jgi:hypothetical protein
MATATRVLRRRGILTVLAIGVASLAFAQRGGFGGFFGQGGYRQFPNIPYDGQFTFVRVNYQPTPDGYWYGGWPAWAHGYPVAERNLMKIMNEVSFLGAHDEEVNTLALDDPKLSRYPIAYIIEVDWWAMTDREAAALRAYMEKGGFVIVDDFKVRGFRGFRGAGGPSGVGESPLMAGGGGWETFLAQMKRVMPEARFYDLDPSQPVFHSFFEITTLDNFPQAYVAGRPVFRGLFEDNDPAKRLMMVVNYNTDISQYWERSGRGLRPFDETNEAYKLGVNYIIYGLTH